MQIECDAEGEAPGRVNLIGEHTDYNGGFVLPTVIPQRTRVQLWRRSERSVEVRSASIANIRGTPETYVLGQETRGRGWLDYVQGITWVLRLRGYALSGFSAHIESDVPLGSGLSSSAALLVALLRALRQAFSLQIDDVEVALSGQRAEAEFVGAPVGVMDQMACSLARPGEALFLDTRSLFYRRVPLPPTAELIVLDSGVAHGHAAGDYRIRRAECEKAALLLGVPQLRDLGAQDLPRIMALPDPLSRRARHVVTENERVLAAVAALETGDLARLGELFYASHLSMRDDFAVSVPEIDLIVELAHAQPEVYGARLTGGGFGGAVVMLTRRGGARDVARRIRREYAARTGRRGAVLVPTP